MATFPTPITNESFPRAWRFVSRKYRWALKKKALKKYALPIGQLLFFPAFWIAALGTVCSYAPPTVKAIVSRVPVLTQIWQKVTEVLPSAAGSVTQQIISLCCLLYLIPLAAYCLVALVILLVYHPKTPSLSGSASKDAETLWTMSRHAQLNAWHRERDIAGSLALITGILAVAAICCGIFLVAIPAGIPVFAGVPLTENLHFFVLALILIFSYGLLNLPLSLLLRAFSRCHVSQELASTAEVYCRSVRRAAPADSASVATQQPVPQEPTPEEKPADMEANPS